MNRFVAILFGVIFYFVVQTMTSMNKVMDPQKMAQTMKQFQMENAKMDMTDEMSTLLLAFKQMNKHSSYYTSISKIEYIICSTNVGDVCSERCIG